MKSLVLSNPCAQPSGRSFRVCAIGFVLVAVFVAAIHATTPITRGWWLVAYLVLVGGLSQILLGHGLAAIVERTGAQGPSTSAMCVQLLLWNMGTVIVAVADIMSNKVGILAGSLLLLVALGSFAISLRRAQTSSQNQIRAWIRGYALLIAFLVGSAIVGTALGGALPRT